MPLLTKAKKMISNGKERILSDSFISSVNSSQLERTTVCTSIEDEIPVSELPSVLDNVEKSGSKPESPFHFHDNVNASSLSPLYSVTRDELIKEQQSDCAL